MDWNLRNSGTKQIVPSYILLSVFVTATKSSYYQRWKTVTCSDPKWITVTILTAVSEAGHKTAFKTKTVLSPHTWAGHSHTDYDPSSDGWGLKVSLGYRARPCHKRTHQKLGAVAPGFNPNTLEADTGLVSWNLWVQGLLCLQSGLHSRIMSQNKTNKQTISVCDFFFLF